MSTPAGTGERQRRGSAPAPPPAAGEQPAAGLHMPASPAAERAVLGAILQDANCFYRIVEVVDASDFFSDANRVVFAAFAELASAGSDIDLLTVTDRLQRDGTLDAAGGVSYVAGLADELPDPSNVEHYARIVRERSVKRQLLRISQQLMASSAREEGDALEVLDNAEAQILQIAERAMRGTLRRVGDIAREEVEHIQRVSKSAAPFTGVETGFYRFDELTSGLQKQDLIILAARPGVGKTAMALNIAANCAVRHKLNVAIFSLEMSAVSLVRRLLAAEARINLRRLARGLLSRSAERGGRGEASDWQRLVEASDHLADAPLWIDDTAGLSVLELRGKARRLAMEHGLDLVIVDYLQLMSSGSRFENRTQEVSAISRGLKAVAKQLNVPLIAVSQLSRSPERRGADSRPQLSDLRESGSIEQDADVVVFISRKNPALRGPGEGGEEDEDQGLAEVIIAKQRNGPTDLFKLLYQDEYTRFENPELAQR